MSTLKELFATHTFRKEAVRMFFEAMRENGWAFDTYSGEPYKRGSWVVDDVWTTNDYGPFSKGETIMSYAGVLVWSMQYHGQYPKLAIPCLKAALRDTYTRGEFVGGRGPNGFDHDGMVYSNKQNTTAMSFNLFRGKEMVFDLKNREILGFHWYHGGFLLEPT